MKIIPTKMHAVLDYLTALLLFALPRYLRWRGPVARLPVAGALATLAYSLLTRYELGLFKLIPMRGHLLLDWINASLFLAVAPFTREEAPRAPLVLASIGLFEMIVPLLTRPEPGR